MGSYRITDGRMSTDHSPDAPSSERAYSTVDTLPSRSSILLTAQAAGDRVANSGSTLPLGAACSRNASSRESAVCPKVMMRPSLDHTLK